VPFVFRNTAVFLLNIRIRNSYRSKSIQIMHLNFTDAIAKLRIKYKLPQKLYCNTCTQFYQPLLYIPSTGKFVPVLK
jgi:hypothetical protein